MHHHQDLEKELESELSGDFEELILGLMAPPSTYEAQCVRDCMKGLGTKEEGLAAILASKSPKVSGSHLHEPQQQLNPGILSTTGNQRLEKWVQEEIQARLDEWRALRDEWRPSGCPSGAVQSWPGSGSHRGQEVGQGRRKDPQQGSERVWEDFNASECLTTDNFLLFSEWKQRNQVRWSWCSDHFHQAKSTSAPGYQRGIQTGTAASQIINLNCLLNRMMK